MRYRRTRTFIIALTAAGAALGALSCSKEQRPAAPAAVVMPADLSFPGLQMRPGADRTTYTLIGRVRNGSKVAVSEVTLNVWMEDVLHTGASTSSASTVIVLRHEVPPGESRSFEEMVVFRDLPKPKGRHEWNYSVAGIRAK